MSAACGLPSALFDLFLESNVMIVANFEIWKQTCNVWSQSSVARILEARLHCCLVFFIYLNYTGGL